MSQLHALTRSVVEPSRRLCIAPMLDWTTRHARYFLRLFSADVLLYTEMVTTGALLHGDQERFLGHSVAEHPLAIQLGGSNPDDLARCAELAQGAGFGEINLNVGCPSDRVQSGLFGACLMARPETVRDCVASMITACDSPVTVKCRLGIDDLDDWDFTRGFVESVAAGGCRTFIVHARKAWLNGLSPKQNREIPPLNYERVYRLKETFPELEIVINGGIRTLDEAQGHLRFVDGVMIGREAYHNPWMLHQVPEQLFDVEVSNLSRIQILSRYRPYMLDQLEQGVFLRHLIPPLMGLFQGQPGCRAFRRHLSENMHKTGAGIGVLDDALLDLMD